MLRRQSLIALGIAVVLGLVAVFLANTFIGSKERQFEQAQAGTTRVAVASIPLDYGMELSPDKVRFVAYPADAVPAGSFANIQELLPPGQRRLALRPMGVNEPILATKISGPGQGASIAALLPDGKRAASVRINDVSGVAGFIQPNDAVDVLITRQLPGASGDQQVTDMLLQNIRVIAMGQQAKNADGQPVDARTATLEVAPLEAQKLALGQQVGQLSLVLRKPGMEQDNLAVQTVSLGDLRYNRFAGMSAVPAGQPSGQPVPVRRLAAAQPVRRPAAAPRPAGPVRLATTSVEVVRGTANSSYEVGGYRE